MAVTIIAEDGTGLSTANTFVDPAGQFATDYAAAWLYGTEWDDADANTRAKAVVSATRTLYAQFVWRGVQMRAGVQALGWPRYVQCTDIPRDAVPVNVKAATMEMALALLQRNRTSDIASGTTAQELESLGLGDGALTMKFATDPQAGPVSTTVPPAISAMLTGYGSYTGGNMVPVERR